MSDATKVAIVVGGGSGIGAAVIRVLHQEGYAIAALSPSGRAKALAESLGCIGIVGTNRSETDLQALVDLALDRYGRIDVVVNSSGHAAKGSILEITDEQWQEGMEMYLMSVIRISRMVTPHLIEAGGGSIVNISTSSPFEPNPRFPVSATIRAALGSFTKLYADEYGPSGIRMNNVLPGYTTEDPSVIDAVWTERIPLRRAAAVTEVAEAVKFLAGEGANYITGQNIRIDGGVTRSV